MKTYVNLTNSVDDENEAKARSYIFFIKLKRAVFPEKMWVLLHISTSKWKWSDFDNICFPKENQRNPIWNECSTVESCGHSILGVDLFGSFFIYEELGHIFLNNTGRKFHKENQDKTSFHSVIINCTNTDFKLISTSSTTKH